MLTMEYLRLSNINVGNFMIVDLVNTKFNDCLPILSNSAVTNHLVTALLESINNVYN